MGGLVTVKIRDGVEFTPEAAAAFRRAEAQVRAEFDRDIDVNSTWRSWAKQLAMYLAWMVYVASGYRASLYPGHSKAVHPSQSFHVSGLALDSDDWRVARIVEILAENGFIRNRLHIPGEQHHFEYLRDHDDNYGKPAGGGNTTEDEMNAAQEAKLNALIDDVRWLKTRVGGSETQPNLTDLHRMGHRALTAVGKSIDWLKTRTGGSVKSAPTITDELRDLRDDAS